MRASTCRLLTAFVVAAAVTAFPNAQSSPSDSSAPSQQPRFRTEANFVRVDAYPTKDGVPVTGLSADDFEIFEDGVRQKIESFEYVVIRPAVAHTERINPGSQRDMHQAIANPRNRVFVLFLDTPHVSAANSRIISEPVLRLLNRVLGPDDLVGIMTPAMSASQITFGGKTEVLEDQLRSAWPWGRRFANETEDDDRERAYDVCYPNFGGPERSELAAKMIARKQERATLESLQDLVRYLHGLREERKAILTVSEGWALYRPDESLMKLRGTEEPPGKDPIVVGPHGTFVTKDPRVHSGDLTKRECDTDRMRLAMMDNEKYFRDILDDANRANASFYPVDPRGLAVFDTPMGPSHQTPLITTDINNLKDRQEALRVLALNTDGIAVMDTNNFDKGLRRIADDLNSYYLIGYLSTNTKLDGRFRGLKVRVTKPGVAVRARRGYRAATVDEVNAARPATAAPAPEAASAVAAAIGTLATIRPDARLLLQASGPAAAGIVWITGELTSLQGRTAEWASGATVDVQVASGSASAAARVALKPGERSFLTSVRLAPPIGNTLEIRARAAPVDGAVIPANEAIRVGAGTQPVMYRRGPSTGNRQVPTADQRFSRSDRLHLEIPVSADAKPGAARLLDRSGQPLAIPVTMGERLDEGSGQRWITADVTLAPLAPGDFAIEIGTIEGGIDSRIVAAVRVGR